MAEKNTLTAQNRMGFYPVWVQIPPAALYYMVKLKSLKKIKHFNNRIRESKSLKKIEKEIEETKLAFKEKIATLLLGGFGLVAALAWNEAIKSLFETYLKKSNELMGKFIYALIVTIIVVIVSKKLEKISEKKE